MEGRKRKQSTYGVIEQFLNLETENQTSDEIHQPEGKKNKTGINSAAKRDSNIDVVGEIFTLPTRLASYFNYHFMDNKMIATEKFNITQYGAMIFCRIKLYEDGKALIELAKPDEVEKPIFEKIHRRVFDRLKGFVTLQATYFDKHFIIEASNLHTKNLTKLKLFVLELFDIHAMNHNKCKKLLYDFDLGMDLINLKSKFDFVSNEMLNSQKDVLPINQKVVLCKLENNCFVMCLIDVQDKTTFLAYGNISPNPATFNFEHFCKNTLNFIDVNNAENISVQIGEGLLVLKIQNLNPKIQSDPGELAMALVSSLCFTYFEAREIINDAFKTVEKHDVNKYQVAGKAYLEQLSVQFAQCINTQLPKFDNEIPLNPDIETVDNDTFSLSDIGITLFGSYDAVNGASYLNEENYLDPELNSLRELNILRQLEEDDPNALPNQIQKPGF